MTTPKVHLLKRPARLPSGRRARYWTLRWSDRRGRHRYKSLGRVGKVTRAEAEGAKRQMIVALGTGMARLDKPSRMTLSEFIEFHETQFARGKRPTTLIEWRTAGNHAVEALGDKLLDEVAWSDAGEIRTLLERDGRSEATIRKTLSMFRAMLGQPIHLPRRQAAAGHRRESQSRQASGCLRFGQQLHPPVWRHSGRGQGEARRRQLVPRLLPRSPQDIRHAGRCQRCTDARATGSPWP